MNGEVKITKATVEATVADYRAQGMNSEEIEERFKAALKARTISVDVYYEAMKAIYE